MQIATHGNGNGLDDLYVLPESKHAALYVATVAKFHGLSSYLSYSDVEGQHWHGKHFVEIPFGCCLADHFASVDNESIQLYRCSFLGRKIGALGVSYQQHATLPATNPDEARELLYTKFEHVQSATAERID